MITQWKWGEFVATIIFPMEPYFVKRIAAVYLLIYVNTNLSKTAVTVVPTKSDSDLIFCLQMFSKTLTCTLQ